MMTRLYTLILVFALLTLNTYAQVTISFEIDTFKTTNKSILELYKQFPIVAIGEGQHNSALTFKWLTTLVNEEAFPDVVDNIVVEFGASDYQWVMDDFVNNKEVPDSLFKKCWRETTQILVWDNPIYEKFFREIRAINNKLPEQKRVRVLLGDPTFGSKEIHDEHTFHIIENEVLKKGQTALLIYGDLHFVRRDVFTNYSAPAETQKEFLNVIQFLEVNYPGKAFSIWGSVNTTDSLTKQIIALENIQMPSFLYTSKTQLGDLDFRVFYPYPTNYRTDSQGNDIEEEAHIQMPMKQIADGIIFRGSWEAQNYLAPRPDDIYSDTTYLNELIRREQIVNIPPYRTRLYFYKVFGSSHFMPFENALKTDKQGAVDSIYEQIKLLVPEGSQRDVLNYTGYFFLKKNEIVKASNVFKLAIKEYPDAYHGYEGMGDAFSTNQDKEMAAHYYKEALLRNPNSKSIKNKLEKLKNH